VNFSPDEVTQLVTDPPWTATVEIKNTSVSGRATTLKDLKYQATGAVGLPGLTTHRDIVALQVGESRTLEDAPPTFNCATQGSGTYGVHFQMVLPDQADVKGAATGVSIGGDAQCNAASTTLSTTPPPSTTTSSPSATTTTLVPPYPGPIHADFNQDAFTTTYTVPVSSLQGLTFRWSVSIPSDPNCASGFTGNKPAANQATWFHKDANQQPSPGPCNHTGNNYGPRGHPGTVTVVVTSAAWRCQANYGGTITGDGTPPQCVRT
jgi:hypothetical protein